MRDLHFAWRSLKRNPGLTALIVVTFTLGIGVNAATFALLDRIYLRPPTGIVDPAGVHRVWFRWSRLDGRPGYAPSMTYPMYRVIQQAWGDGARIALTTREDEYHIGGTRRGTRVAALFATANYWSVLGIRPQLGRFYSSDEDRIGAGALVIVLTDHLWRSQFGADPNVLGKPLQLDTNRYTIIGVAPAGFIGDDDLRPTDAFIPLGSYPQPAWVKGRLFESHDMFMFLAVARATPAMDLVAFDSRATRAIQEFNRALPNNQGDTLMTVASGPIIITRGPGRQDQSHLISTRLSAVALIVLIIATANVVNLLLARATRRRREIAVRLALGISRWRLVRMLTTETLLLAALSAIAAVLAAWWGGTTLRALLLPDTHFVDSALDVRVVGFTLAIALVSGLVAGMVPALQASKPDLTRALKEGSRDGTVHRSRLRSALVMTQAALSVVLLAGAALFVESLRNVRAMDIGYDAPPAILTAEVSFDPGAEPPRATVAAQVAEIARRLDGRPGVQAVGRTNFAPFTGYAFTEVFIGDSALKTQGGYPGLNPVTRNFFAASGLKVLRGTVFEDVRGAPRQVVINDAFARQIWPGADPMGRCMKFKSASGPCFTVVGVVETARRVQIIEEPVPQYYLPLNNLPPGLEYWGSSAVLMVRAGASQAAAVRADIRRELQRAFPGGYPQVQSLSESLESQYRPWRLGASLFTGFGLLALIVAVVGIYSTVSYGVSQRTHEFGVRMALGARIADVLRLVLVDGLRTVVIGVIAGVGLAVAAGRLITSLLYGVKPGDPTVMVLVSITLLVVAALATLVPAWRAGRVDPVVALRSD